MTIEVEKSQVIELAKAYNMVAGVRIGDKLSRTQHGDLVHDCVRLDKIQKLIGIELINEAKMNRVIEAFRPEEG